MNPKLLDLRHGDLHGLLHVLVLHPLMGHHLGHVHHDLLAGGNRNGGEEGEEDHFESFTWELCSNPAGRFPGRKRGAAGMERKSTAILRT